MGNFVTDPQKCVCSGAFFPAEKLAFRVSWQGMARVQDFRGTSSSSSACGKMLALPPLTDLPSRDGSSTPARRKNRVLDKTEVKMLEVDDFLLGHCEAEATTAVEGEPPLQAEDLFARLDEAMRQHEFAKAEAVWRSMPPAVADDAACRPELRSVASQYVSSMRAYLLDEFEDALERRDTWAARRLHNRLMQLRLGSSRWGDATCGDANGRGAELEARYQQYCSEHDPIMCSLVPSRCAPWPEVHSMRCGGEECSLVPSRWAVAWPDLRHLKCGGDECRLQ